jgi:hypothetical protein
MDQVPAALGTPSICMASNISGVMLKGSLQITLETGDILPTNISQNLTLWMV